MNQDTRPVVVSVHLRSFLGRAFIERARSLARHLAETRGTLVAFGSTTVSFSFAAEDVPAVLEKIASSGADVEEGGVGWSVGLAQGDFERLADGGWADAHGTLGWGVSLVVAEALAREAEPSETLGLEPTAALLGSKFTVSGHRVVRDGTRNFSCVRIEKRDSVASVKPLSSKHGGGDVDKARELFVSLLPPQGEASSVTERMRVLSQLGRGDIGDALRVLRRARADLDPKDHAQRCQASLAIAVALSVVGRSQEALLEGMDALSRARHAKDERGEGACLAFLAKLFGSVGREELARAPRVR